MKELIDYFIDLYHEAENLSQKRQQILQNDLCDLISKLSLINQLSSQVDYDFKEVYQLNFEELFLAPKTLTRFRKLIDISINKIIENYNDSKSYQMILHNLEQSILKLNDTGD